MGRRRKETPEQRHGVLVLDKPSGPTSTDCLNAIRKRHRQNRIGHAGTLDPLASGVLVVLLGQATKLAPYLTEGRKTYLGELLLGKETDTWDIQGEVVAEKTAPDDPEAVKTAIRAWGDLTEQEVPAYSAAKHQGKPLYALARAGADVPVKTKLIEIFAVEPLDAEPPRAEFRVTCSAGTYIRSLVHSLGTRMGCGAVLTRLTREASEPFRLDAAHSLDDVLDDADGLDERIIPLARALPHFRRCVLAAGDAVKVRNGARLPAAIAAGDGPAPHAGERAMFLDADGSPLALAEAAPSGGDLEWRILRGLWT